MLDTMSRLVAGLTVAIALSALNALALGTQATDKPNPPEADKPQSKINEENFEKIKQGKGKLTEADVVALLGPATRKGEELGNSLIWEEKTHITVTLKDGKAVDLRSEFSPNLKSETITEDNFKKLKRGMGEAELQKVLGLPTRLGDDGAGSRTLRWEEVNWFEVQFTEGKVSGYAWWKTTEDKKSPKEQPRPAEKKQ